MSVSMTPTTPWSIALVAHDNRKDDILDWSCFNQHALAPHRLFCTGTTGRLLTEALGREVVRLQSGPLGGDQQLGALIAQGEVDMLVFFWDPLQTMPHDPDVRALLRIAAVWNIPVACNRASADMMISSPLIGGYQRLVPDYSAYRERSLDENRG